MALTIDKNIVLVHVQLKVFLWEYFLNMHNRIASFKKFWFMLAIVLASFPISASADYKEAYKDHKMGQAFAGEFANAYAFLLGQTETIKKIEKSYPNSLIKAKNAFNLFAFCQK